jgi:hypothetical protein
MFNLEIYTFGQWRSHSTHATYEEAIAKLRRLSATFAQYQLRVICEEAPAC